MLVSNIYLLVLNMQDRLAEFFNRYNFSAHMFYAGTLCLSESFDDPAAGGYMHLIRHGAMTVFSPEHPVLKISKPSLLFYPRSTSHRFVLENECEVDLVCAALDLGGHSASPLAQALPAMLLLSLDEVPGLGATLELLFAEAQQQHCGRQAAIDRLFEYLLIQVLRHVLDHQPNSTGLLAGLADRRLAKAITAIHNEPRRNWSLDVLAQEAGMSRARFAVNFREIMGMTPGSYLSQWRMGLAQVLLKKGKPVAVVADEVGYSSVVALSRAFKAQTGLTPQAWKKSHR